MSVRVLLEREEKSPNITFWFLIWFEKYSNGLMAIIKIQYWALNNMTMHRLHNSSNNRRTVMEQSKSRILSKYSWLSFSYLFFIMDTNKDIQHQLDKINERLGIMICNNFHFYLFFNCRNHQSNIWFHLWTNWKGDWGPEQVKWGIQTSFILCILACR